MTRGLSTLPAASIGAHEQIPHACLFLGLVPPILSASPSASCPLTTSARVHTTWPSLLSVGPPPELLAALLSGCQPPLATLLKRSRVQG